MPATSSSSGEHILRAAHIVKDMAERVISNGEEPSYAIEKLSRAHTAIIRALIRDLRADPQELIAVVEKESDPSA
jgi:chaperonin GroEL (HSP60 family)